MPFSVSEVEYITLEEACKIAPGRPHKNTLIRWCDRGYSGIRLKSWRMGRRRFTTRRALDDFLCATSGLSKPNPCESISARQRAAEARLDALGI